MAEMFIIDSSAVLNTEIYEEDGVTPAAPTAVTWRAVDPLGNPFVTNKLPTTVIAGQTIVLTAGTTVGFFPGSGSYPGGAGVIGSATFVPWDVIKWNGSSWSKIATAQNILLDDGGKLIIPPSAFVNVGLYSAVASFTLPDGVISSVPYNFEIVDPLGDATATADPQTNAIGHAWMKLEDLFDSELGGPWLRDKTISAFSRQKMAKLLPDALYYVNNVDQPVTAFTTVNFPYDNHSPLISQALLVESIYHLMRSYVEQPQPVGQSITYFDRRDYLNRWSTVLQSEEKKLQEWLQIFKLQYTQFGSSALLIGGYASSLARTPAGYRTRYPKFIQPYRALF